MQAVAISALCARRNLGKSPVLRPGVKMDKRVSASASRFNPVDLQSAELSLDLARTTTAGGNGRRSSTMTAVSNCQSASIFRLAISGSPRLPGIPKNVFAKRTQVSVLAGRVTRTVPISTAANSYKLNLREWSSRKPRREQTTSPNPIWCTRGQS
jgi:hypothetical protein